MPAVVVPNLEISFNMFTIHKKTPQSFPFSCFGISYKNNNTLKRLTSENMLNMNSLLHGLL